MHRFGWQFIQENIVILFLTFLAVEFLAIVQFCPETPVPENTLISITVPAASDDKEATGKPVTGAKLQHTDSKMQRRLQQLDQRELSVQGLAFLIFGLEAVLLVPFVIGIAWFYHIPTLTPAPKTKPETAAAVSVEPVSAR